jgi:pyocin large subunit-like protein
MKDKRVLLAVLGVVIVICAVILGVLLIGGGNGKDADSSSSQLTVITDNSELSSETASSLQETVTTTASVSVTAATTTTASSVTTSKASKKTAASSSKPEKQTRQYKFRSQKLLDQHFEKHGSEFGNITKEDYLRMANELINSDSDSVLSKTEKEDGDYVFFDKKTGYFAVLSKDGYIRTFFIPDRGIDYYNKQ